MTAAPPVDRAATSRLVAALEHAWTAIRTHAPDVPQAVIVVASGSDPGGRRLPTEGCSEVIGTLATTRLRFVTFMSKRGA
jgi:hypothetical protein